MVEISQSSEISRETKLELSKEFNGADIFSISQMDSTLKEVKTHKAKIEKAISSKNNEKNKLDSEIQSLESELEKFPLDNPKRQELETKIEQKKQDLVNTEVVISELEKSKPKDVSFPLRKGVLAKLNLDGSRSILIPSENFTLKLPSNFLPLTTTKNLRTINLSFPFAILKKYKIAHLIFPNVQNNAVPSKSQRDLGHQILSSLNIDDTKILSQEKINTLNRGLSIFDFDNGKTQMENLIDLEIYNVQSQSLDKGIFSEFLRLRRQNRI